MPPDNAGYFHAAYAVVGVLYLGYALLLVRRRAAVRRRLEDAEG
jgi:CcmD family protein